MVWYHQGLKERLSERGHDISLDFDELRHLTGLGKADYGRAQDNLAEAEALGSAVRRREFNVRIAEKDAARRAAALEDREGILERREAEPRGVVGRQSRTVSTRAAQSSIRRLPRSSVSRRGLAGQVGRWPTRASCSTCSGCTASTASGGCPPPTGRPCSPG